MKGCHAFYLRCAKPVLFCWAFLLLSVWNGLSWPFFEFLSGMASACKVPVFGRCPVCTSRLAYRRHIYLYTQRSWYDTVGHFFWSFLRQISTVSNLFTASSSSSFSLFQTPPSTGGKPVSRGNLAPTHGRRLGG